MFCCGTSARDNKAHVFITAGQSNTDGRVRNIDLPDYIKIHSTDTVNYTSGEYPYCRIIQNSTDGKFKPFWPKGRLKDGLWAYDAVTYKMIENALNEPFYVIKWAVGGTSIAFPVDTVRGKYWSADKEWLKNTCSSEDTVSTQNASLMNRFLAMLEDVAYRHNRQVTYYADALCVTPKYLSEVSKKVSGYAANYWINRYTTLDIARMLRDKSQTFVQISDMFGFSSPAYFCRYVQRTLGMNPIQYREL